MNKPQVPVTMWLFVGVFVLGVYGAGGWFIYFAVHGAAYKGAVVALLSVLVGIEGLIRAAQIARRLP